MKPLATQADELYSRLVKNLENEPTPNSVKNKKIQIIQNWKEMYEKELRGLAWSNIKNANVRNAVMKYASERKTNGAYPTRAEIEKYRDVRSRLAAPASPKVQKRRAAAEVEEL
jgi:Ribonuclease G/E